MKKIRVKEKNKRRERKREEENGEKYVRGKRKRS